MIIDKIVMVIDFKFEDNLVEIGLGFGVIIEFVVDLSGYLIVVELDKDLVECLISYLFLGLKFIVY